MQNSGDKNFFSSPYRYHTGGVLEIKKKKYEVNKGLPGYRREIMDTPS